MSAMLPILRLKGRCTKFAHLNDAQASCNFFIFLLLIGCFQYAINMIAVATIAVYSNSVWLPLKHYEALVLPLREG